MDPKLTKWLKWLKVIHDDIQDLVVAKREFSEVQGLIKNNPKLHQPSSFYHYLARTYVSHVTIGLRRQIKCDSQSISFARLMTEMIDSPATLSRKYYVGLYKGSTAEMFANRDFEKFSDISAPHIKASLVCDDLATLRTTSERCEEYADRRIAHWDKREPKELPTYNDLDKCVELLDELYVKYHLLFHASSMESLLPDREFDWKGVFREPWIPAV
ncbi:MAG: hypothetical protein ABI475_09740 [Methylophilaceae bacterium]